MNLKELQSKLNAKLKERDVILLQLENGEECQAELDIIDEEIEELEQAIKKAAHRPKL